ncbi:tyrosine phosphatase family protein [Collimonas fungivorans]|uniref:Tyrosine phosphatase family protein n=1 Tax=Collimonas fungivorans TaxID=158899 RepID=A0A127PGZ1_9BURK|nr:tyrosine-protein phosphatase [Collimonas fungivorans]AMO97058.1 tyrosine phosphatase family protein [Collimonas fungivorans]
MLNPGPGHGELGFEAIRNIRDLGGYLAADGRRIAAGRLLRGANPGMASAADIRKLKDYRLDVVLDFRTETEKHAAETAFASSFNWIADPVMVGNLSQEMLLPMLKSGDPESSRQFMIDFYSAFPVRYQSQFRRFLQRAEQNQTMLYHCTAGKDRTGFASALLLSALGVGHAAIIANYLESNRHNAMANPQVLAQVFKVELPPQLIAPLMTVESAYLDAALAVIDEEYGGMERYLRQVLEIDVERVRNNYLV